VSTGPPRERGLADAPAPARRPRREQRALAFAHGAERQSMARGWGRCHDADRRALRVGVLAGHHQFLHAWRQASADARRAAPTARLGTPFFGALARVEARARVGGRARPNNMGRIAGYADRLHSDVLDCAGELHQATHSVSAGMQSSCARPNNNRLMASRADRLHLKVLDCAGSLHQATRIVFLPSCTSASDCVRGWFRACQ
jgi:hypothetical protein